MQAVLRTRFSFELPSAVRRRGFALDAIARARRRRARTSTPVRACLLMQTPRSTLRAMTLRSVRN